MLGALVAAVSLAAFAGAALAAARAALLFEEREAARLDEEHTEEFGASGWR